MGLPHRVLLPRNSDAGPKRITSISLRKVSGTLLQAIPFYEVLKSTVRLLRSRTAPARVRKSIPRIPWISKP